MIFVQILLRMASSPLSIEALPGWARLNDVKFVDVKLQHIEGKGIGLVAARDLDLDPANRPPGSTLDLLKVPHELVLTAELVENYAKVDHNFEQLLAAAGRQVTQFNRPHYHEACSPNIVFRMEEEI